VDLHGQIALAQSHGARRVLVEDLIHHVHLDEVVARAERAEL
jgi:hypothetical protein